MSGELEVSVGGARRALAELAGPALRLLEDFAAAEARVADLEPSLPLLAVDLFGGIPAPGQEARAGKERRARRGPTGMESLAVAIRASAARPSPAVGGVASRLLGAAPAPASAGPLFRLAAAGSRAAGVGRAPRPADSGSAGKGSAEVGGIAGASAASPQLAPASIGRGAVARAVAAETAGATIAVLTQLTESILAATAGSGATGVPGTRRAPAPPPSAGAGGGSISDFLAETLRSVGGDTAAAFGLEPEAPGPGTEAMAGEGAAGASPRPSAGAATAARSPRAGPDPAPARAEPRVDGVPRPAEVETDPAALAALVNDALVEQARRHGLELG